jgi:hypothetical protein
MVEQCSARRGNLAAVHWYRAPVVTHDGERAAGVFNVYMNRIVLADEYREVGPIVRHEMLHALLRENGHPRAEFFGTCAAIVDCACRGLAGWHAGSDHPLVLPADSFDVGSDAKLLPREADGERWLALEVWVSNPRAQAAVVAATDHPRSPPIFGYDLRGPSGGRLNTRLAVDSSQVYFNPFETKRWLYEFKVSSEVSDQHVSPGQYLVRGAYARHFAAYDTVLVIP